MFGHAVGWGGVVHTCINVSQTFIRPLLGRSKSPTNNSGTSKDSAEHREAAIRRPSKLSTVLTVTS